MGEICALRPQVLAWEACVILVSWGQSTPLFLPGEQLVGFLSNMMPTSKAFGVGQSCFKFQLRRSLGK